MGDNSVTVAAAKLASYRFWIGFMSGDAAFGSRPVGCPEDSNTTGVARTGMPLMASYVTPKIVGERSSYLPIADKAFTVNQAAAQCDRGCVGVCMLICNNPVYCASICCW